jgi:uncharacterized protein (TIGR03067 family)
MASPPVSTAAVFRSSPMRVSPMKTQYLLSLAACLLLGAEHSKKVGEKYAPTELEGTWRAVSFITRGETLPEDSAYFHSTTFTGNASVSKYGDKAGPRCVFRIDVKAKPKRLDVLITEGRNKGQTILAIYELKENTLTICGSALGKERPSAFESTYENQQWLEVLKRE